jgi:hypothetical protein
VPDQPGHNTLSLLPPVASISAGASLPTPSVFSALSTGSAAGTAPSAQQQQKPQMQAINVHPTIQAVMPAYVQKFHSIRLLQMLTSLNLTLDDLPTLPTADSTPAPLCYNYVLGKCVHDRCQHRHIPVAEITNDFATRIVTILTPAINNFMTNGALQQPRRPTQKRRRAEWQFISWPTAPRRPPLHNLPADKASMTPLPPRRVSWNTSVNLTTKTTITHQPAKRLSHLPMLDCGEGETDPALLHQFVRTEHTRKETTEVGAICEQVHVDDSTIPACTSRPYPAQAIEPPPITLAHDTMPADEPTPQACEPKFAPTVPAPKPAGDLILSLALEPVPATAT